MLRKFFCFAVLAVFAVPAQAGVISSLLSFNGSVDILSDDSASVVRDVGVASGQMAGNGFLDEGDVIQAVFEIRLIDGAQTSTKNATVLGIVALEVESLVALGADTLYNLQQVSAGNAAYDLSTLLSTTSLGGLSGVGSSSIALITDDSGNFTIDQGFANSLTALDGTDTSLFGLDETDWTTEVLLGISGGDDFYQILLDDLAGLPGLTDPNLALVPNTQIGSYLTAQTVIDSDFGAGGTVFVPLTITDFTGASKTSEFVTAGNNQLGTVKLFNRTPSGFTIADDGDFAMNPVPEPSSLAVFACLGVASAVRRRRRKQA